MPFLAPAIGAVGGAIGGAISFLGSGTILAGVANMGLGLAAKYAVGKLMGGPDASRQQAQQIRLSATYGEAQPRFVVLGRCGVAGHHVYRNATGTGNRGISDVYILSHFMISAVSAVRVKGAWNTYTGPEDPLFGYRLGGTDGVIWHMVYRGLPGQFGDLQLIAHSNPPGKWTTDHRGTGIAYAKVNSILDKEHLTSPWEAYHEVYGAPLYDWRKDSSVGGSGPHRWNDQATWEFTENPVLMMYALERGLHVGSERIVGKGTPASRLPLAEWTVAANICDELVSGAPRYRAGLIAIAGIGSTHDANMEQLREACAASWVETPAGVYPLVGASQAVVATFTDDDLVVGETLRFSRKRPRTELVNTVAATTVDREAFYENRPLATRIDAAAQAEDGERLAVPITYEAVNDKAVGDRLSDIALRASRYQASAEVCLLPAFIDRTPVGRWIRWNSALYGDRRFQIVSKRLGQLSERGARNVYLTLQEVGEGIFDPTAYSTVPLVPWPAGTPVYESEAPNFTASGVGVTRDGTDEVQAGIQFTWDAFEDVTVVGVEIEFRPVGETESLVRRADVPLQRLVTTEVLSDTEYEYRHRVRTEPYRTTFWTAWDTVTTPTSLLPWSLYDGVIDLDKLSADMKDIHAYVGSEVRDLVEQTRAIALRALDQDLANYSDKREIRERLTAQYEDITASYESAIYAATGPGSALAGRIEEVEVTLDGVGGASGLLDMFSRLSVAEDTIDLHSAALISVDAALAGKASASSVLLLDSRVTSTEGSIVAMANALIGVAAGLGGNGSTADVNMRFTATAAPGGYLARWALQGRVNTADSYKSAGLYADVSALTSRIVIEADQVVITKSGTYLQPFVFDAVNGWFVANGIKSNFADILNVSIGNAHIQNLAVDRIKIANGAITDPYSFVMHTKFVGPGATLISDALVINLTEGDHVTFMATVTSTPGPGAYTASAYIDVAVEALGGYYLVVCSNHLPQFPNLVGIASTAGVYRAPFTGTFTFKVGFQWVPTIAQNTALTGGISFAAAFRK